MAIDSTTKRQVFVSYVKENSPQIDRICNAFTENDIHYLSFYQDWDTELKRLIDIIKREENESSPKNI